MEAERPACRNVTTSSPVRLQAILMPDDAIPAPITEAVPIAASSRASEISSSEKGEESERTSKFPKSGKTASNATLKRRSSSESPPDKKPHVEELAKKEKAKDSTTLAVVLEHAPLSFTSGVPSTSTTTPEKSHDRNEEEEDV
eukprot:TRINITY_DN3000_c0_g1_i3.p1 TRINITY_DN3000_c0_g1~~TRINITY_DN3000_c0_g1_i3.p1  ORF type:complete len:143 (-),score=6.92 TRINITY_DN3000_c0_g1_i3:76-504(-)